MLYLIKSIRTLRWTSRPTSPAIREYGDVSRYAHAIRALAEG